MHRSLGLVVVLMSACSESRTPAAPPGEAAPQPAAPASSAAAPTASPGAHDASPACAEQAAHLGAELRDLAAAQPGFLPLVQGITAPVTSTAKPVDTRGVVVAVTRDGGIFAQGLKLDSDRDVRDYLEQVHRSALEKTVMAGGTPADATFPLYIWADAATPIRAVAAVAAAVEPEPAKPRKPKKPKLTPEQEEARKQAIEQARAAGILGEGKRTPAFAVRLIVTSPAPASPPAAGPPAAASEPEATRHLADQLKAAIGTCEPISTSLAMSSLEGVPAKEAEKLVTDVPKGLQSCGCKVADLAALTSELHTWFGAWAPSLRWIELPKLKATDKRPIGQLVAK